jgi:hypothetical protein
METNKVAKLWNDFDFWIVLEIFLIAVGAWLLVVGIKSFVRWLAEKVPGRYRL